jgi:hypothetical protein
MGNTAIVCRRSCYMSSELLDEAFWPRCRCSKLTDTLSFHWSASSLMTQILLYHSWHYLSVTMETDLLSSTSWPLCLTLLPFVHPLYFFIAFFFLLSVFICFYISNFLCFNFLSGKLWRKEATSAICYQTTQQNTRVVRHLQVSKNCCFHWTFFFQQQ